MSCIDLSDLGFKDKVILITGSSSGLGASLAVTYASMGAKLIITGRNQIGLDRTRRACEDVGCPKNKIFSLVADISKEEDCKKIVQDGVVDYFGRLDILINNAGIVKSGTFAQCSLEDFDEVMNVNVRGMFLMTRSALPWLKGSKGNIVNISSFTAIRPVNDYFAYCLSKTAVDQFTKTLALEMGHVGVRVNSVCPGIMRDTNLWIRPGMVLHKNPLWGGFILKKICSMYPLQRPSHSDEVVPSVLFLTSEKCASFMTGTPLLLDGGKALTSEQA